MKIFCLNIYEENLPTSQKVPLFGLFFERQKRFVYGERRVGKGSRGHIYIHIVLARVRNFCTLIHAK